MGTRCQMAVQNRSGGSQNLGVVLSFLGKKWGGQLQTKKIIVYKFGFYFTLFCKINATHFNESFVEEFG